MSDETSSSFSALGLSEPLLAALSALGYEAPTPIQERTIPPLLAGRDLIGQAQTGTGKTAAFALPILQRLDPASTATQALVLTPTRELAMQVAEAFHSYAQKMRGITVLPVYGGTSIVHQLKRLERGVQIVVGTPGRLIDHLDRKTLRLEQIRMIVLDEADEMLKMGFIDEVERILSAAPPERQTALFSATIPEEIRRIAARHLSDPEVVAIEHHALTAPPIEQRFINVSEGQKLEVLTQILELDESEAVLIFRRTKTGAAELADRLDARGFGAVAMHGDMNQQQRESVIRRLRSGQAEIVVATDVAARGLDVEQISHVINYDIPYDAEAYVHRIGRTGRAGKSGIATLFVAPRERRMMREIERFTGSPIKPMKIPTRADVAARRVGQMKDSLRKTLQEGDLDLYMELVEQLAEEGPHDIAEIAAAAARLASIARPLGAPAVEPSTTPEETEPPRRPPTRGGARSAHSFPAPGARTGKSAPHGEPEPRVRLSMAVGKRDGIRPADIVGSIANEADVPGNEIGPIDIRDDITYVSVPERVVEHVLESVGNARFRGRALNVRVAGAGEGARPPREGTAPRRDFRPGASRPAGGSRGPSSPRPRVARTFQSAPSRVQAGQPRGSYAPRNSSEPRPERGGSYAPRQERSGSFKDRRTSGPREERGAPVKRGLDRGSGSKPPRKSGPPWAPKKR